MVATGVVTGVAARVAVWVVVAGVIGAGGGMVGSVGDIGMDGAGSAVAERWPSVTRNPSLILSRTTLGGVG